MNHYEWILSLLLGCLGGYLFGHERGTKSAEKRAKVIREELQRALSAKLAEDGQ